MQWNDPGPRFKCYDYRLRLRTTTRPCQYCAEGENMNDPGDQMKARNHEVVNRGICVLFAITS